MLKHVIQLKDVLNTSDVLSLPVTHNKSKYLRFLMLLRVFGKQSFILHCQRPRLGS